MKAYLTRAANTDSEQYKTGRVHGTMLLTSIASYNIKQILLSISKQVHNHM